jgi:hypothetical protein
VSEITHGNCKFARGGITIPQPMLLRADRAIE